MRAFNWVLALFVVCGCATNKTPVDPVPDFDREFQERYVEPYVSGRIEDWLDVFADDAVALHDGLPPLEGKPAIKEFGDAVRANFHIKRLDAEIDEIRRHGDWVWTRGRFVADFAAKSDEAPPGVAGERMGKFLLLWEKQEGDGWQVIMDMGNSIQPPPEER